VRRKNLSTSPLPPPLPEPVITKIRRAHRLPPPDGHIWIRWCCSVCKQTALFTIPKDGTGTWPFEISLGMHREISRQCKFRGVTLRGGLDGILEVILDCRKARKGEA